MGYLCGGFSHRDALSVFGQLRSVLYAALFRRCNGRLGLRRQLFAHLRYHDPFFAATGTDLMDLVFTQLPLATLAAGLGAVLYTIIALFTL